MTPTMDELSARATHCPHAGCSWWSAALRKEDERARLALHLKRKHAGES